MTPEPIHREDSCTAAFQLNWALSLFGKSLLPGPNDWLDSLRPIWEADGIRVLEARASQADVLLFWLSTQPQLCPSEIIRLIKGRIHNAIKTEFPQAFRRNYRMESIGSVTTDMVVGYVTMQPQRHPADSVREQLERIDRQLIDPECDLNELQYSSHGQFLHNLHVVVSKLPAADDFSVSDLDTMRGMIRRLCESSGWRLARAGLVGDHLHCAIGVGVGDAPRTVAVRLLNNLEYALGMRHRLRSSYYVGTFGPRNRGMLRHAQP